MGKGILAHGLASQMLASLSMLKDCIDRCPLKEWDESHNDYPFSQVVFHTLFDCDYNLSKSLEEFKGQIFHLENSSSFADYEELEDRIRRHLYERDFIDRYYEHCWGKIESGLEAESDAALIIPNADIYRSMTRLERYVNAIRHTQHHAAQLGLRLQFLTGKEMDWIGRGYEASSPKS